MLSVDGGTTWVTVLQLYPQSYSEIWKQEVIDLDAAGLTYTDQTMIRFSHNDDYPATTDGLAFDEIKIDRN